MSYQLYSTPQELYTVRVESVNDDVVTQVDLGEVNVVRVVYKPWYLNVFDFDTSLLDTYAGDEDVFESDHLYRQACLEDGLQKTSSEDVARTARISWVRLVFVVEYVPLVAAVADRLGTAENAAEYSIFASLLLEVS